MRPLYFDYNATTPVLPRVFQAMAPYFREHFGNPSSDHMWGLPARRGLAEAREAVAGLIGCGPGEVVFTSCATESNHLALYGTLQPGDRLVTSTIEHPAIIQPARDLAQKGVEVDFVPVDADGLLDLAALAAALQRPARLVSVMLANNETGALQPVAQAAGLARAAGALMHCDASQAVGKVPVDCRALGVDMLTVAGHKLYAPKGVGALMVREGVALRPLLRGGGQEGGRRSGTENVALIAGLGEACRLAGEDLDAEMARQRDLGARLEAGLAGLGREYRVFAAGAPRLPQTLSLGFKGLAAGDILSGLVAREVGVSAGAACHGGEVGVSHVLTAMAAPAEFCAGALRISWGRPTTAGDVDQLLERLGEALAELG